MKQSHVKAKAMLLSAGIISATLFSCDKKEEVLPDTLNNIVINAVNTVSDQYEGNTDTGADPDDLPENSSFDTKIPIVFGSTIQISNPLENAGVDITDTDGNVVINSTVSGVEYEISGTSANSSLKIYSDKKFKLTLNGVHITNPVGPAINIQSKKRAFIQLAENSENSLKDGQTYQTNETEDSKGTLFAEGQLIISGSGKLSLESLYGHAIVSDQYIRLLSGTIEVTGAKKDGLHANDAVIIDNGSLQIQSEDDGIQCEKGFIIINDGNILINSTGKAITASYDTDNTIDPYLTINGGTIVINTKDEGIESKSVLTINDGEIRINATDDAINAGTFIYINGGSIYAHSTGNDGIDSNGPLTITGGKVLAIGARSPEAGIDCDQSTFKITGGIVVGLGGSTSVPTANASTQPSVILGGADASVLISVISEDQEEALTFSAPVSFTTLLFSSPKLTRNKTYYVYSGGEVLSGESFSGLYTSGTYSNGTRSSSSFTTTNLVTQAGGSTGPGGRP